jgi:riboflavin kinase
LIEPRQWFLLLKLAELGGLKRQIFTTTSSLAKELLCSQQTASRWLRELSQKGLIERKINLRGEYLSLTKKGRDELMAVHAALAALLRPSKVEALRLAGRIFTGIGEGAYYITRNGYEKQFIAKLGYKPYPGTVNLRLSGSHDLAVRREIEVLPSILIEGFSNGVRTYGTLRCIPVLVDGKIKGHVILIQRTHYDNSVVEVIAPICIREALKLKDGDLVRLEIPLPQLQPALRS